MCCKDKQNKAKYQHILQSFLQSSLEEPRDSCLWRELHTYAIEKFWNNAYCVSEDEWLDLSKDYSVY